MAVFCLVLLCARVATVLAIIHPAGGQMEGTKYESFGAAWAEYLSLEMGKDTYESQGIGRNAGSLSQGMLLGYGLTNGVGRTFSLKILHRSDMISTYIYLYYWFEVYQSCDASRSHTYSAVTMQIIDGGCGGFSFHVTNVRVLVCYALSGVHATILSSLQWFLLHTDVSKLIAQGV